MEYKFALGTRLKCRVTGFTGIAVGRIEYINGCIQYGLKPVSTDGKMPDAIYIDQQQLDFVDNGIAVEQRQTGGEMPDAPKR